MKTKRNLLGLLMLATLSLAACGGNDNSVNNEGNGSTPTNSETTSNNGGTVSTPASSDTNSEVGGGNEEVGANVDLTAASLLGYTGGDVAYVATESTATVAGVEFSYIQVGCYGNGIQMRDSTGDDGSQRTSLLWNSSAFAGGIQKIELTYASTKDVKYANPDAVIFSFGTSTAVDAYTTKLSTTAGVKTYTITPDATTYTFFKLEHDVGFSFYWDSIKVYYAA